jgi:glycogen synthase
MKILHVFDHSIPLHSGYTFRSRAILQQQRALGWETCQLTSIKHTAAAGEGEEEEEVDGLRFCRTPAPRGISGRLPVLNQWAVVSSLERRLAQLIPRERPDILHAHSPSLTGIAALRAGRRHGLPVVYECRAFWEDAASDHGTSVAGGPRYRLTRALETWVFRRADAVTTICEGLRRDILARGVPGPRVTVIPNGVDVERFRYCVPRDQALGTQLGLDGKLVLGFLGSFYGYEGLSLAVTALPGILSARPEVRLLLVGGGPQADRLAAQVRDLGLESRVLLTGRVPHDQVDRYYSLVDILVYPRLPMRLTELVTPLKPLEAMAQGKLVLASDVGGHRELIRDGVTGRLFKAGDSAALATAALAMLADRGGWQALRDAGRRFVEQERSWRAGVERYRSVYEGLLAR